MNLTELLAERKANNLKKIPTNISEIMEQSTQLLLEKSLSNNALKVGETLPEFSLPNALGKTISSTNLKSEYLVLAFYRGGWCPYCNLELKALQSILNELSKLNAELIAITPETPDNSLSTAEKNELTFTVLSDIDNLYAKSLGLVFKLPEDLIDVYKGFNLPLDKHNGNEDYELPMPATYILNKERAVIYSFVPEDYTLRLDPNIILDTLKKQV